MQTSNLISAAEAVTQNEVVSDAQMWALIIGFGLPLLVAVIQQPRWENWVRVVVSVSTAIVAGGGTAYFAGQFTGRSVVSCALIVTVASIASYQSLWKPTRIAPMIEAKTSPGDVHVVTTVQRTSTAVEDQSTLDARDRE